jgi:hypothetical protein
VLPTSPLPVAPATFATSVGTWLALVAVGALVVLVVGYLAHRRQTRLAAELSLRDGEAAAPSDRLSA